jgi:hypothetical protein
MPKSAGIISTLFRISNFEDELHGNRIPELYSVRGASTGLTEAARRAGI